MVYVPERGDPNEVFRQGRGYQPPAGGGGLPPGWGEPPHLMGEVDPFEQAPRWPTLAPTPPPDEPPPVIMNQPPKVQQVPMEIPDNLINLERGTAAFQGYLLELSQETISQIQTLLAGEVLRKLEEERLRVLQSIVPVGTSIRRADVSAVPRPEGSMGQKEPPAKVLGVRVKRAYKRTKNVPNVPSPESSEA